MKDIQTHFHNSYSPTNDAEDEFKNNFFKQLHNEIDATPANYLLLNNGDINAKVESCNENREYTMGVER